MSGDFRFGDGRRDDLGTPMKREAFYCDGCGVEKKDVNRWWLLRGDCGMVSIESWKSLSGDSYVHACGEKCALEMASRWMQSGKLVADKASPAAKDGSAA